MSKLLSRAFLEKEKIRSGCQEILHLLQNPNFHYRVRKLVPLDPNEILENPVCNLHPIYLLPILIIFSHLRLAVLSDFFFSGFSTKKFYALLISHSRHKRRPPLSSLFGNLNNCYYREKIVIKVEKKN
jgi:hypothetical protein